VPRAIIEPPKVINLMEALKRSLAPEALVTTMLPPLNAKLPAAPMARCTDASCRFGRSDA
jgi:hypothetical protein